MQNLQHKTIQETWDKMSLAEQMANIGSEVERSIKWKEKNNHKYSEKAFYRALELFDLTLKHIAIKPEKGSLLNSNLPKLTEIARARELFADYFIGENKYNSTKESWQKYFLAFNRLAKNNN